MLLQFLWRIYVLCVKKFSLKLIKRDCLFTIQQGEASELGRMGISWDLASFSQKGNVLHFFGLKNTTPLSLSAQ